MSSKVLACLCASHLALQWHQQGPYSPRCVRRAQLQKGHSLRLVAAAAVMLRRVGRPFSKSLPGLACRVPPDPDYI